MMTDAELGALVRRLFSELLATSPQQTNAVTQAKLFPDAEPLLVDTDRAAELMTLSPSTLTRWRGKGKGPPFVRLGSRVMYRVSDLEDWIATRLIRSR
ncbi:MAG: helix-turn-helix domain-containing protein [Myxococcales bacterium]|nr:helix-turn-helix domain-containing protein [Myxococcales bacterium]